tara:strand:- start:6 stop:455 length:450 start_codon:yes stop_codon:yes gene_type:complete
MPRPKIWDSSHQAYTIHNWITSGLILREGETYKGIYSFVMSIDNCNLCKVKFNDEVHNQKRCMDHDHSSGYFRQVLCMKCNKQFDRKIQTPKSTKTGHMWISLQIQKKKQYGKVYVYFHYKRPSFKEKTSVSLTKIIAYSFINLLKKPV